MLIAQARIARDIAVGPMRRDDASRGRSKNLFRSGV
jgi:hypothetical protein